MSNGDKSNTDKRKRLKGAAAASAEPKGAARPEAKAQTWATVSKLHDGGKNIAARRKVPSGPLGGSGRKTNLSRSS